MSKEDQEKLGLQAAAEVYKQMPVLPDSNPSTQYIQRLGKKLAAVIPQEYSWPYQFHVIQQKEINAFALPGGPMFVNVGAITAADNEAELVGVMAHEMSHVYLQHSAKQAGKAQWVGLIGALGGVFGGSTIGNLARAGIQFGAGSIMMKYSRDDEAQADATGAIIMYKAGYNPQALADFFEKLQKESGPGGPQFLSDHPNPGNRTASIQKEIGSWPAKKYSDTSASFASAKAAASKVQVYNAQQIADGAKQGIWIAQNKKNGATVRDLGPGVEESTAASDGSGTLTNVSYEQVRPSSAFTELRHSAFNISYPANWKTGGDQNSVTIAPPAGVAQGSIAYGVMISGANAQGSLDQQTQSLVQSLEQSNPGLRASGNMEDIAVNGSRGKSVYLVGNSPVQKNGAAAPERDWLVTLPRADGGLLYLVFISPESDFAQLKPIYQKMLDSLQVR